MKRTARIEYLPGVTELDNFNDSARSLLAIAEVDSSRSVQLRQKGFYSKQWFERTIFRDMVTRCISRDRGSIAPDGFDYITKINTY